MGPVEKAVEEPEAPMRTGCDCCMAATLRQDGPELQEWAMTASYVPREYGLTCIYMKSMAWNVYIWSHALKVHMNTCSSRGTYTWEFQNVEFLNTPKKRSLDPQVLLSHFSCERHEIQLHTHFSLLLWNCQPNAENQHSNLWIKQINDEMAFCIERTDLSRIMWLNIPVHCFPANITSRSIC
jgi:hypothetical protein